MEKSDEWQPKCSKINQRGKFLLESGQWADCNFLVGTDEGVQKQFKCHKLILSMASPVFEAMFYGSTVECNDPIKVPDVQADAFKLLLDYIYTDDWNIMNSWESICELLNAAIKYELPHLEDNCINYLSINVTPENVYIIYKYTLCGEPQKLLSKCYDILEYHTKEVLTNINFENENNSILNYLLMTYLLKTNNNLAITNELDLFDAATRYLKVKACSSCRDKKDYTERTAENKVNNTWCVCIRTLRTSLLRGIRFLTLTAEQFASGPANSNLLSESESYAILMNIATTTSKVPVPEGFSTSRVSRAKFNLDNTFRFTFSPPTENNLCVKCQKLI